VEAVVYVSMIGGRVDARSAGGAVYVSIAGGVNGSAGERYM
jgi:hypothetical protein